MQRGPVPVDESSIGAVVVSGQGGESVDGMGFGHYCQKRRSFRSCGPRESLLTRVAVGEVKPRVNLGTGTGLDNKIRGLD